MQSDLWPKGYGFHIKASSSKIKKLQKIYVLFLKYCNQKNNVIFNIFKEMHHSRKDKQTSVVSPSPLFCLIINKINSGEGND